MGIRKCVVLAATSLCAAVALFAVGASGASAAESCPNEAFRTGYSAQLPDCRAYELVSPPGIQPYFETFTGAHSSNNSVFGAAVLGSAQGIQSAIEASSNSRIAFFSNFAPAGATSDGPYYLSSRGPDGWSTQNIVPPQSTEGSTACLPAYVGWSSDLEEGILADGFRTPQNACGADEPELAPGEARGVANLFRFKASTVSFDIVNSLPIALTAANAFFQAGSDDLRVIVFDEEAKLTPGAPEGDDFYVARAGSAPQLLTVLPDGTPAEGELADATIQTEPLKGRVRRQTNPTFVHAVAPDGSRAAFVSGGDLYARENPAELQSALDGGGKCVEPGKACSVQVDASETSEPGGEGVFAGASGASDDLIYFTDVHHLTADSTAEAGEPDLYAYDSRKPEGERLQDLSVDPHSGEHANVLGVVGANETGAPGDEVYFVATGVLAENTNTSGATAVSGSPNLYVLHGGVTRFIAGLSPSDNCDWNNLCMTARVSRNGRYLGFDSFEKLTGVENRNIETHEPDQDIFLYDSVAENLRCASCGDGTVAPSGPASIRLPVARFGFFVASQYLQRNVSDDGRVFFDTVTPLLSGARNGQQNVYEYDAGTLSLLSSGTSEGPSFFYDASADGTDVYLITAQELVKGADSAELAIYDVRAGGGFPPQSEAPRPCDGEGCSGPQSGEFSGNGATASETFMGPGDLSLSAIVDARPSLRLMKTAISRRRGSVVMHIDTSGPGVLRVVVGGGKRATVSIKAAGPLVVTVLLTRAQRQALRDGKLRRLMVRMKFRSAEGEEVTKTTAIRVNGRGA